MESWKVVFDEAAFQFFISSTAANRNKLLIAFEQLRGNPQREADYESKDVTGRTLSVWAVRPFLITFWLDAYVSEIRIVNIQKVQF